MQWKYVTEQGDTWDAMAFDFYGSEKLMHVLMSANPDYINVVVFDIGIEIIVPQAPKSTFNQLKAPWDD